MSLTLKKVILDLMCGGAYPSRTLAKENDSTFVWIDINLQYLQFANSKAKEEKVKEKLESIRADVRYLPLRDKSVDLTFSIGGPEYLPDIGDFFKEVKRVSCDIVGEASIGLGMSWMLMRFTYGFVRAGLQIAIRSATRNS